MTKKERKITQVLKIFWPKNSSNRSEICTVMPERKQTFMNYFTFRDILIFLSNSCTILPGTADRIRKFENQKDSKVKLSKWRIWSN